MDLSKILSISGKPGLYQVISQAKHAVIVESLIDKKRFPAFGNEKMSSLEEISIFTTGEDLPLKEVLKRMHEKLEGKEAIDPKSDTRQLHDFFLGIIPDYDQERVYSSDIRKVVSWYTLLQTNQLLDFSGEEEGQEQSAEDRVVGQEVIPEKQPVKKSSAKKVAKKS